MLYVYPKFNHYDLMAFRLGGPGLANLLFPWARSIVGAKKYDAKIINPTWPSIKLGPLIRCENDIRNYIGLFNEHKNSINGVNKISVLLRTIHHTEEEIQLSSRYLDDTKDHTIIYQGLKNYFEDIKYEHAYVKEQLYSITKDRHKLALSFDFSNSATIHVRLGDFKISNQQTDINWFKSVITMLRREFSEDLHIYLISDGNDNELSELTNIKNVSRLSFGSSISDLLALSKSNILVTSKSSTFGIWGAYLGRMKWIAPVGHSPAIYYGKDASKQIEIL